MAKVIEFDVGFECLLVAHAVALLAGRKMKRCAIVAGWRVKCCFVGVDGWMAGLVMIVDCIRMEIVDVHCWEM